MFRPSISSIVVATLVFGVVVFPPQALSVPAHALVAGACSDASGTMTCNMQGKALDFSNLSVTLNTVSQTVKVEDVFKFDSNSDGDFLDAADVRVDATLTVTARTNGGSISKSGTNLSASISTNNNITVRIDFSSGGRSVVLENLQVSSSDLDGGGQLERARYAGIKSYTLRSGTGIVVDPATAPNPETGSRSFLGGSRPVVGDGDMVSVVFQPVSSIGLNPYSEGSGGVVGFAFGAPNWFGDPVVTTDLGDAEYTITYDANGADAGYSAPSEATGTGSQTLSSGGALQKTIASQVIPVSSWNTRADGTGVKLALGGSYRPISNITLFAQYETSTVTFKINDGSATPDTTQIGAGLIALTANSFVRDGFRFTGWNTSAAGDGQAVANQGTFSFDSNRILYAQWTRNLICPSLTSFAESDFRFLNDASVSGNTVTLTPNAGAQKGGFWSVGRINLSEDFCVSAETNLGTSDAGADGIALVLQSVNSSSLTSGGGLGYAGISPSLALEIDTYNNGGGANGDIANDHLALMKDGDTSVHNAWGPAAIDLGNVEDNRWRLLTFEWDASAKTLTVFYDQTSRFSSVSVDLPAHFASSNGSVFWGFTGATGGAMNLQQVRNVQYASAQRVNVAPQFVNPPASQTLLVGSQSTIQIGLSDDSTVQNQWGRSLTVANSSIFATAPSFTITGANTSVLVLDMDPTEVGSSLLTLTVTDADGAVATHSFTITNATELPPPPAAPAPTPGGGSPASFPAPRPPILITQPPASGPVLLNNQLSVTPNIPTALVNGVPTQVQTLITDPNNLSIRAGALNIGINVQQNQGLVRQGTSGETELQVRKGAATGFQGSGLAPRSFMQVFMPLQGSNSKELARIPVDETGSFRGEAVFQTSLRDAPLPIGRQTLQLVSVDERGRQNVVEMAVNIVQPAPSPEINRENGQTPKLSPGQSLATNAGLPEVVDLTVIPNEKQTIIEGNGWSMGITLDSSGSSVSETEDGNGLLELIRDDTATVSGSGFMPGTRADVWLFSEPTILGTVEIDENGEFTGVVSIEGQVIATGEHTLQIQGVGEDGYVRAANLGVLVKDAQATFWGEVSDSGLLWWLLIALAIMALAILGYLRARPRS
jgi:hypothetical protein